MTFDYARRQADWPATEFDRLCVEMGYTVRYHYNLEDGRTVRHLRREGKYHAIYKHNQQPLAVRVGADPVPHDYYLEQVYTKPEHIVDRDYFGYVDLGELLNE